MSKLSGLVTRPPPRHPVAVRGNEESRRGPETDRNNEVARPGVRSQTAKKAVSGKAIPGEKGRGGSAPRAQTQTDETVVAE
jgi:hypothetical protein